MLTHRPDVPTQLETRLTSLNLIYEKQTLSNCILQVCCIMVTLSTTLSLSFSFQLLLQATLCLSLSLLVIYSNFITCVKVKAKAVKAACLTLSPPQSSLSLSRRARLSLMVCLPVWLAGNLCSGNKICSLPSHMAITKTSLSCSLWFCLCFCLWSRHWDARSAVPATVVSVASAPLDTWAKIVRLQFCFCYFW